MCQLVICFNLFEELCGYPSIYSQFTHPHPTHSHPFCCIKNKRVFCLSHLNELHDAIRYGCFAEFLQVFHNVRGLQSYTDRSIEGICCQLVFVDMNRPAYRLCNGHQEILSIFVNGREGLKENVSIWSLEEKRQKNKNNTCVK